MHYAGRWFDYYLSGMIKKSSRTENKMVEPRLKKEYLVSRDMSQQIDI